MNKPPANQKARRQTIGQAQIGWIVVLVLLALGAAAIGYLALNRGGPNNAAPPITQEQINKRLGKLQQEFQTVMQEKLDPARFEPKARVFTQEHPDEAAGHVLLAQVRMRLQKWGPAYSSWTRSLTLNPDAFELCKMAGFCAAKLGRYDNAIKHYQGAIKAAGDSADSEVFAAVGQLYLTTGDLDAAEQAFTDALSAPGPGEKTNWKHEAHSGLANVASVRGDYEAALVEVDAAIRLGGIDSTADVAGYHIQKARIYLDADRQEDAITMLRHTWQSHPDAQWRIESARLQAKLYERDDQIILAVAYIAGRCNHHQNDPDRKDPVLADFTALLASYQIKANLYDAARTSLHNLEVLAADHPKLIELRESMP